MISSSSQPENVFIPWACLQDHVAKTPIVPTPSAVTKKSFADAVTNVCDIPVSQLPLPVVKGDRFAIAIPENEYQSGLTACKHNLHGRVIWPKGTTPLKVGDLKSKLAPLWKSLGKWGITSLGKGFYEFYFSSLEDSQSVCSVASWNLRPGTLKLFPWTKDFNPSAQQNSTAQVWLRIYGLSQEYWRPKILFAIASSVGTPICTDQITIKSQFDREFGHFVRVLVDLDLKKQPVYRVLVERVGFAFFVDFEFENKPEFCHFCNVIGHDQGHCKRAHPDMSKVVVDQHNKSQNKAPKNVFNVVKDNRIVSAPIVEVINLEGSTSKAISSFDPLLDSMLQNKNITRNETSLHSPSNVQQPPIVNQSIVVTKNDLVDKSPNIKSQVQQNVSNADKGINKEVATLNDTIDKVDVDTRLEGQSSGVNSTGSRSQQTDNTQGSSSQVPKSQNRFEVLATQNPDDSDIEDSEQAPVIEIESSIDTDFVEESQSYGYLNNADGPILENIAEINTMNFLKQSWANLAEAEEAELKIQEVSSVAKSAPQPIVKSKSKLMTRKQVSSSAYGTRSRTGNNKHSK
jgi:hypothetical protein